jgi:hypothetical protein
MDQTQLQQQIAIFYAKLPSDVQANFASMSWLETLRSISTKYNLTENQITVLGTETTLAFLGITSMKEYEEMLIKDLSLPKEIVDKMIGEIDTSIFKAIRPQLESTYNMNVSEAEKQNTEEESIDPKFSSLPEDLRKAIGASDYQNKLYNIGTKHKLPISIMAQVEDITVRLLMGSISASQYENELSIATDLNATKTREIATDVNNDIIMSIRDYMKNGGKAKEEIVSTIDEVPKPPYAQEGMIEKPMPKAEQGIYEKAGIEFVEDFKDINKGLANKEEKNITSNESNVLSVSGIDMVQSKNQVTPEHIISNKKTEKEMLEGIENPVATPSSIIGDKLTSMTTSANTVSDYTLPKIATQEPTKKLDPYKEQI